MSNTVEVIRRARNGEFKPGDIFSSKHELCVFLLTENEGKLQMIDFETGRSNEDISISEPNEGGIDSHMVSKLVGHDDWEFLGRNAKITISFGE